ncbi:MAG: hypothetical protein Ta2A_17560 [Treponemataceae bacterium]|nr:MAG: hypothetical protein Ta2A_17560 [Treponemataceae bacterium]
MKTSQAGVPFFRPKDDASARSVAGMHLFGTNRKQRKIGKWICVFAVLLASCKTLQTPPEMLDLPFRD